MFRRAFTLKFAFLLKIDMSVTTGLSIYGHDLICFQTTMEILVVSLHILYS